MCVVVTQGVGVVNAGEEVVDGKGEDGEIPESVMRKMKKRLWL